MSTLCGHERAALIWALSDPDPLNNAERERKVVFAVGGVPDFAALTPTHKQRFAAMILDPAKLAELMAEELRRRGIDVGGAPPADRRPYNVFHGVDLVGIVDWSHSNKATYTSALASGAATMWNMPQARAALLRILQLPEGTSAQDVLKALEVGT